MAASPPTRRLPEAVRQFLHVEAAGGIVLLAAAVVALVWANSPWSALRDLWHTELASGRLLTRPSTSATG